jgi:hypothetical protein
MKWTWLSSVLWMSQLCSILVLKMLKGNLAISVRPPFIICRKFRKTEPAELVYDDAVPGKCICIMYYDSFVTDDIVVAYIIR